MKNKKPHQPRINRLEAELTLPFKIKLDRIQATKHCKQPELVNELILSVTEEDLIDGEPTRQTIMVDVDLSDKAHQHWQKLSASLGKHATKRKVLEAAIEKQLKSQEL